MQNEGHTFLKIYECIIMIIFQGDLNLIIFFLFSVGQSSVEDAIPPSLSWQETFEIAGSGDEDSLMGPGRSGNGGSASAMGSSSGSGAVLNPVERRTAALQALKIMAECRALQPHLHELLSAKYESLSFLFSV